jgi:hypothetical protein
MKRPKLFLTLCFVVCCLLSGIRAEAQYSFSPSTLLEKYQPYNMLSYDSIHIANLSADTLHLNWTLLSYDSTAATYLDFCSSGVCFLGFPATGIFPPIVPGGFGYAGAHFWTGIVNATATAKIWVYPQGNVANGDTLTFLLHSQHGSGIEDNGATTESVTLFPNPVNNTLHLSGQAPFTQAKVYDAQGRCLLTTLLSTSAIDISTLPRGMYFVQLGSANGSLVKKFIKD